MQEDGLLRWADVARLLGAREVDDMIAHHAAIARTLAEGLPSEVVEAVGGVYEQWDGNGWPGELKGAEVSRRPAQLAEFVEVAHRGEGLEAAKAGPQAWRQAVVPTLAIPRTFTPHAHGPL